MAENDRRKPRARCGTSATARAASPGESAVDPLAAIPADTTSPSMQVHRRDSAQRLRDALAELPDEQREVLERYYLRDESFDDIAVALARSRDAIRGICYRARQQLREILGRSSCYLGG